MKTITYDETKWKLVPVQPTEKMYRGGRAAMTAKGPVPVDGYEGATYAAMLSSAPTPPSVYSFICPKCGADRSKVPCPGDLMNCPIRGEAQSAFEQRRVDPCPQCVPGSYCATATCGRLAQMQSSAQGREDAEAPDWMTCESRGPLVVNSLRYSAEKMRADEKRCRGVYKKAFMGVPFHYLADAYGEAASVFEARIKAIDAARKEQP